MIRLPTQMRSRIALACVVALLPAAPIVAGFVITAGSAAARGPRVAAYSAVSTAQFSQLTPEPPSNNGALVAVVRVRTTMRATPGGRPIGTVRRRTEFGSPQELWVFRSIPGWLGVVSPLAGNGRIGWIPRSAASIAQTNWELKVSLSARRLTVLLGGLIAQRYTVAIGRPDAPTPAGRFEVTDLLTTGDPGGPYGCCILALSAKSPHAIQGWGGGNRIAIHSTPDTGSIGQPVSHGCLRLTLSAGRWLLSHIPLGTPTLIST